MKLVKMIIPVLTSVAAAISVLLNTNGSIIVKAYTDPDVIATTSVVETAEKNIEEESETAAIEAEPECVHDFGEYEVVVPISYENNGVEARHCVICGLVEERDLVCEHESLVLSSYVAATCYSFGEEIYACECCGVEVYTNVVEKTECTYSDWEYIKYATPIESGVMRRACNVCNDTQNKNYTMEMAGANSIYIPGTSINHEVHVGDFTQSEVDNNNIVYTEDAWGHGENNPFVLGHNTGTMKHIDKINVGQYIYVSVNGVIEVYEVVVSEFAMQNDSWTDIVGQTTGTSVWDSVGEKTLHMYTCHGVKNGRWLVLAKLVEA